MIATCVLTDVRRDLFVALGGEVLPAPRYDVSAREFLHSSDPLSRSLADLGESSTLLRLARLLRVVRVITLLPLRVLIVAVARSIPPLASMTVLTALILFLYGMAGWLMFGEEDPEAWGNIGEALLTLFVLLTLENFPVTLERGLAIEPRSILYFVSFVLVAAFIVLNVLIGVVLHSMEEAREIERARERRAAGEDGGAGAAEAALVERIATLRAALDELELTLRSRRSPLDVDPARIAVTERR